MPELQGLMMMTMRNLLPQLRNVVFAGLALVGASPALSQTAPALMEPETAVVSPGGVDMVSGVYRDQSTDLTIGSEANGGITFTRVNQRAKPFTSNWHYFLKKDSKRGPGAPIQGGASTWTWELESMAVAKTWLESSPGLLSEQGIPTRGVTKLELVGSVWRFVMNDGTVILFETGANGNVWASKMTRKDGVEYTFKYDNGGDPADGDRRLRRVTSNTGYFLILEYVGNGHDRISRACVFSSAMIVPPPATTYTCPAGAQIVSYDYGTGSHDFRLASFTDQMNKTWTITHSATGTYTQEYRKPGLSDPWMTNSLSVWGLGGFKGMIVNQQSLADGRTIVYDYENLDPQISEPPLAMSSSGRGIKWTVNGAVTGTATTTLTWDVHQLNAESPLFISPAPYVIEDPLGRRTTIAFGGGVTSAHGELRSKGLPGGRTLLLTYNQPDPQDPYGLGEQHVWTGPSVPNLTTSYVYDCTISFNCAKPKYIIDPNAQGSTNTDRYTEYKYSHTTGLLESETMPEDVDGKRPQKRYGWAPKTALYMTAPSTWTTGTVLVLESISECRTGESPTCVGTADETVTTFAYPASNVANNLLPISKTVRAGNSSLVATTTFTYDAAGNKVEEDGPLANTTTVIDISRWKYDVKRRVTHTMSPDPDGSGTGNPLAVRNTYDDAGRLTKVENGRVNSGATDWATFAVIDSVETDYDLLDRKVQERKKSAAGFIEALTQYSYDSFGRLDCTTVRMNKAMFGTQQPAACAQSTGAGVDTVPYDRITRNTYDAGDQLLTVTEGYLTPDQAVEATYTYTGSGKKETLTDARGYKAQMVYDGHDRQTEWRFPNKNTPGVVNANDNEHYTYDNNGNRLTLKKRDNSVLSFDYDNLNRVTKKKVPNRTDLLSVAAKSIYDVAMTYDLQGHQLTAQFVDVTLAQADDQGLLDTSDYDALGRLKKAELTMNQAPRELAYEYDIRGIRTSITHPDTIVINYTPDTLGRLTGLARDTLTLRGYSYDVNGRLFSSGLGNASGAGSSAFGYDSVGRLNLLTHNVHGTTQHVEWNFEYSPASQLLTQQLNNNSYAWAGAMALSRIYTTNGLNQYTAAGTASFTYDANGNLITDGTNTYTYDVENRLVLASMGGTSPQTVSLRYDPMGRLYEVAGSITGTTRFLYDGDELIGEYNAGSTQLRRYVHGLGVDDPVVWYEGATTANSALRHLITDRQGSVVGITNDTGSVIAKNTYDEYGIPKSDQAGQNVVGRFAYTGQIWLPELGMYHYKARLYSPTLGRFMQTDPIGYDDQINLYAYVGNDPINYLDSDGQQSEAVMDRRNQALSTIGKECEGIGAKCAQTMVAAIDVAATAVGAATTAGLVIKGVSWGWRALTATRAASWSQAGKATATGISRTITRDFNRNKASGLANAIRSEVQTGKPTGGKFHIQKGIDALKWAENQTKNIASNTDLSKSEKEALTNVVKAFEKEIESALNAPLPR